MDVLLTGNLSALTPEFVKQLSVANKVVLVAEDIEDITKKDLPKEAMSFSFSISDAIFDKLFKSYSFGAVIFFANRGEQQKEQNLGNLEDLNRTLRICSEHNIPQVIYVSSSEVYAGIPEVGNISEKTKPVPTSDNGYMMAAGESLCRFYKEKNNLNTVILHVPYIYGDNASDTFLTRLLQEAAVKKDIILPGDKEQLCDFIKDTDLAKLIGRIIDEGYHLPEDIINVGSGKPLTYAFLAEILKEQFSDINIAFSGNDSTLPPPVPNESARKYYDWIPLYEMTKELAAIAKTIVAAAPKPKNFWTTIREKAPQYRYVLQGLELILGFLLMEYLNNITETSVMFRFVDFRLLYVIVFGSVHGMFVGIIAAVLACISCIIGYAGQGLGWQVLLYNVNNWLPFVAYLIAGIVTGYTRDKSSQALTYQKEQMQSLEEHYLFLYELYDRTLENKSQYKDQLMSYRESFGRIYTITQKLDNTLSDAVFQEAINVLEDVLDNKTIAIYTVSPDQSYGRLAVCSRSLSDKIANSIKLSDFSVMVDNLFCGDIWYNKDLLEGYPAYCAPVYDQGRLAALIIIHEAEYEKMATYYINLIKVICGLIQASLVRAANYHAAIEDKIYVRGTHILTNEKFTEILSVRNKMKEDQIADFVLLQIEDSSQGLEQLGHLIDQGIRKTDVAGLGKDGTVYLILSQANKDNLAIVQKRLAYLGLRCSEVKSLDSLTV